MTVNPCKQQQQPERAQLALAILESKGQPVRVHLTPARIWGGYVALFCTRDPKYGRPCATLGYRA